MLSPGQRAPPSIGFYSRPLGAPDLRLCARRIAFTQPVPIYSNSAVEKAISERPHHGGRAARPTYQHNCRFDGLRTSPEFRTACAPLYSQNGCNGSAILCRRLKSRLDTSLSQKTKTYHDDIATMQGYRRMNYKQRASAHDFIWNNPPRRSFAIVHRNRRR